MIVKVYNHKTEEYSYYNLEEFEYAFNNDYICTSIHSIEFIYDNKEYN